MARDGTGAAFILPLLMKLTAADWSHARTLAPQLDDAVRRACKIHRAQPVFEADGQPTPARARKATRSLVTGLARHCQCLRGCK